MKTIKIQEHFGNRFQVTDRVLGKSINSEVRLAIDLRDNTQLACKIFPLRYTREDVLHRISYDEVSSRPRNVSFLCDAAVKCVLIGRCYCLDPTNKFSSTQGGFVPLVHMVKSPHNIYLFTKLPTGGDLFTFRMSLSYINEYTVRAIIRQVLVALSSLHEKGRSHGNINTDTVVIRERHYLAPRIALSFFNGQAVSELRVRTKLDGTISHFIAP